jgi:hypothetical protein
MLPSFKKTWDTNEMLTVRTADYNGQKKRQTIVHKTVLRKLKIEMGVNSGLLILSCSV